MSIPPLPMRREERSGDKGGRELRNVYART